MVQVTDEVRDGRSQPSGPSGRRDPARRSSGVHRRPLVAAGAVLLLWFVWLLVPAAQPRDAAVTPAGEQADPDGLSAQLFPEGEAPAAGGDPAAASTAAPTAASSAAAAATATPSPAPPSPVPSVVVPSAVAPPVPAAEPPVVPQRGAGSFTIAPGGGDRFGSAGTLVRYTVEVEDGVPLDVVDVAGVVDAVLGDPRSWPAGGDWSLQRTDDADAGDVHIRITSPDTTDELCAPLRTNGLVSCRNGDDVLLNALRWTEGATAWGEDVAGYREYLVNHELGHYLGNGHVDCPEEGEPAPVMLQQTIGLQGCAPNGWPFP